MIFSDSRQFKALNIPFNWNVDYIDNTNYSEYSFSTHKKNDFYSIDNSKAVRFGLFGQAEKMFFEVIDGSFKIKGRRVDVEYHTKDGRTFGLTSNFEKKDFITFKEAYTDLTPEEGLQKSNLKSINFGYKTLYKKDDVELFFKPIVSIPINDSIFISLRIASNKDLDGFIVIKSRNTEIERFEMPLKEGKATQINWTVKRV